MTIILQAYIKMRRKLTPGCGLLIFLGLSYAVSVKHLRPMQIIVYQKSQGLMDILLPPTALYFQGAAAP